MFGFAHQPGYVRIAEEKGLVRRLGSLGGKVVVAKAMTKFGSKEITPGNRLDADDVLKGFGRISPDGESHPISGEDYLRHILRPRLVELVPREVQALFEVARGAMAYGYFFYPLYTLAAQQLFRVAEAAVAHKCRALAAPKSKRTLKRRINWLVDEGIIPRSALIRWDAVRELRNAASHPDRQSILTPGNAIGVLGRVAQQINSLFSGGSPAVGVSCKLSSASW